jgi:hypothetical protein
MCKGAVAKICWRREEMEKGGGPLKRGGGDEKGTPTSNDDCVQTTGHLRKNEDNFFPHGLGGTNPSRGER